MISKDMQADLLILNGDVREDIAQTRNINSVILNGRIVDRKTPSRDAKMQ